MLQIGRGKASDTDRISDLPDSILHHTLSFLPTYDAVHTCVLARRWRYIWMGIHALKFEKTGSSIPFIDFAHKVLILLHDSAAAIKKVTLTGLDKSFSDPDDIRALVFKILCLKLQELHLYMSCSIPYTHSLFSCKSLTVLKLEGDEFTCFLPASVCFPSLKIVYLCYINFIPDEGIQQIFINCPILEDLIMEDCFFDYFDTMHIDAPGLRRLKIETVNEMQSSHSPKIKIYAESLVSFDVINGLAFDFSLCNVSCIISASIDIYENCFATSLMQGIQNVKELTLTIDTVRILSSLKNLLGLPNLTKLTLDQIQYLEVEIFTEFFCSLPPIQSLVITSVCFSCLSDVYHRVAKIPRSFISQLNSVEIRWFDGEEIEVSLVEFLLKNGRAMEKLILVLGLRLTKDVKKQNKVMGRLLNLPRASTSCLIVFSQKH